MYFTCLVAAPPPCTAPVPCQHSAPAPNAQRAPPPAITHTHPQRAHALRQKQRAAKAERRAKFQAELEAHGPEAARRLAEALEAEAKGWVCCGLSASAACRWGASAHWRSTARRCTARCMAQFVHGPQHHRPALTAQHPGPPRRAGAQAATAPAPSAGPDPTKPLVAFLFPGQGSQVRSAAREGRRGTATCAQAAGLKVPSAHGGRAASHTHSRSSWCPSRSP